MSVFRFYDMCSGGFRKTEYTAVIVEAESQGAAVGVFMERFGLDPDYVTCDCCGEDFFVSAKPTVADALANPYEWGDENKYLVIAAGGSETEHVR